MAKHIQIKKGLDIVLQGVAAQNTLQLAVPKEIKIVPDHYPILPKLSVKVGDKVEAGSPLLYDKNYPEVLVVSPLSGEVTAINRGDRRKLLDITIKTDTSILYKSFAKKGLSKLSAADLKKSLLEAGLWSYIKQRPFDALANPSLTPKAIFVSSYDSAPLAPDFAYIMGDEATAFQAGLDAISKLTEGKVYLGVKAGSKAFSSAKNVVLVELAGPHPVGNPSVMIQQLEPINKGDIIWTLTPQAVLFIGRFIESGKVDFTKTVALCGPEVKTPQYYKTIVGAGIKEIIKDNVSTDKNLRFISGNVLTGTKIQQGDALCAPDNQLTVIAEGDEQHELLGWAMPRLKSYSVNHSYFTWLFGNKIAAKFDARLLGGRRAIIMSGEYDKVFPFDILPEYLIKAMITKDIDRMEALGIYELIPEDFALCEFVCTSKVEIQKAAKDAIAYMRKEIE